MTMQRLPKKISAQTISVVGTPTTICTIGANTTGTISALSFTNTDTVSRTITVHLVPSGGSIGAANMVVPARGLAAGEMWVCSPLIAATADAGATIQCFSDVASKVNAVGAFYETTV